MSEKIEAPFTQEQVKSLNDCQKSSVIHPFTCANGGHEHGVLIALLDGWHCPMCDYTQNWAHDWMANGQWVEMFKKNDWVIANPLKWQEETDKTDIPLKMSDSTHFWTTCLNKGLKVFHTNNAPEFNEIIIALDDYIGVKLSTDKDNPNIDFRFVDLTER